MSHKCHWPGCQKEVPPKLWGCSMHWFTLPPQLRYMINHLYVSGQEITKTPSKEYVEAAKKVQDWIKTYELIKQKEREATTKKQSRNGQDRQRSELPDKISSSVELAAESSARIHKPDETNLGLGNST